VAAVGGIRQLTLQVLFEGPSGVLAIISMDFLPALFLLIPGLIYSKKLV